MRLTEEKAAEVSDDGNDDDYLNDEMAMRILMMTMMKVIMLKTRKL